MIARSDRIAAVTALASFAVEIDLNDRFQAARLSASVERGPSTIGQQQPVEDSFLKRTPGGAFDPIYEVLRVALWVVILRLGLQDKRHDQIPVRKKQYPQRRMSELQQFSCDSGRLQRSLRDRLEPADALRDPDAHE